MLLYYLGDDLHWGLNYWYENDQFHQEIGNWSKVLMSGLFITLNFIQFYYFKIIF